MKQKLDTIKGLATPSLNHSSDARDAMLDLPGFYWDEERQRYFALQAEHVARSLHQ